MIHTNQTFNLKNGNLQQMKISTERQANQNMTVIGSADASHILSHFFITLKNEQCL